MKEHPLLMTGDNVNLIDKGLKTQTRRLIARHNSTIDGGPASKKVWDLLDFDKAWVDHECLLGGTCLKVPCPSEGTVHRIRCKYRKDDVIWLKETWGVTLCGKHAPVFEERHNKFLVYEADKKLGPVIKRPSIYMPRWAARHFLKLTKDPVAESLQDISTEDCIAEGMSPDGPLNNYGTGSIEGDAFAELWDSINGKKPGCSWADNPWVWVVEFEEKK